MAQPRVYTWPAASAVAISQLQTTVAAGSLLINGTLAISDYPMAPNYVPFIGISRTVSLTSANNLAGVNVTVTGTYRGNVVSETRVGPNANTVYTTQLFDTVTAVSVSAAAAAISVGSGTTGRTNWYDYNYHATVASQTQQVVVTGAITYSFSTTLDDIQTIAAPTVFTPIAAMTAATTSQFATIVGPLRFSNITISASAGGSLVATFVQQGIT